MKVIQSNTLLICNSYYLNHFNLFNGFNHFNPFNYFNLFNDFNHFNHNNVYPVNNYLFHSTSADFTWEELVPI